MFNIFKNENILFSPIEPDPISEEQAKVKKDMAILTEKLTLDSGLADRQDLQNKKLAILMEKLQTREAGDCVEINEIDLTGMELPAAIELCNVNLMHSKLVAVKMMNANLQHSNLSSADLSKIDLSDAKLNNATLIQAVLTDANIANADLQNANFFTYCFSNPVNYICYDGTKPRKPNFIPRKPQRKGAEKRQPTGSRERNVGHPNGEEHSRVPKGNKGVRHSIFWLNASYSQWNPIENTKITLMENFSINNYENFSMSKNNQEDSSFTTLSVNDYQPFRANNKSSTDDSMLWLAIGASILIIAALCLVPLTGGQSLWLMIAL